MEMMKKGFLDRLNYRVNTLASTIPLDLVLLGAPLDEAVCIDINHGISSIASTEGEADNLSFGELEAARLPLPSANLFVQFHTTAARINSDFPGWLGLHIVPFSVARRSHMFSIIGRAPQRLESWPLAYAMVIYREWPQEISVGPAGMLLGLSQSGAVIDVALFALSQDEQKEENPAWAHVSRLTTWIVYLTFCTFNMVNQGEARIKRVAPGFWQI